MAHSEGRATGPNWRYRGVVQADKPHGEGRADDGEVPSRQGRPGAGELLGSAESV